MDGGSIEKNHFADRSHAVQYSLQKTKELIEKEK
jgi:hypothetical protein